MTFNKDLKKVMILYPDVEVKASEEYKDLINLHNIAEFVFNDEEKAKSLVKAAFNMKNSFSLNNSNDYYNLMFKAAISDTGITKVAYPMNIGPQELQMEHDIEKWSDLVYKIYDSVINGDMSLHESVDYYSQTLDKESGEDKDFKLWVKYFQDGEHKKYSSENKKEAFQFPLSGPGFYGPDNAIVPELKFEKQVKNVDEKEKYFEWRSKLYAAIRRIDKLLRQSDDIIDVDSQRDLADLLHQFDQEVRTLKYQKTASDLAFKYANKFKKLGFNKAHDEFLKYSQQIDSITEDISDAAPAAESNPPEEPKAITPPDNGRSSIEETLVGESGAKEGEYEALAGEINLSDAVGKLEEIAGRLADRRTIRLLAEFDIMLDKIGIAPMFPELAEAQSKLIDGYSYALTRVTKMLGMLSSGKSLVEISDARKNELTGKTMKEVNKEFEAVEESESEEENPALQEPTTTTTPAATESPESPVTPVTPPTQKV